VEQRGSLVAPDRLRFDFTHDGKVSSSDLTQIEREVNRIILENYGVVIRERPLAEARADGAMALFGEKYGDVVRTVAIINERGDRYSLELCGGIHVRSTAEIGPFLLISEGSVSAGIRRVEAVTGSEAIRFVEASRRTLQELAEHLSAPQEELPERIAQMQAELAQAQRRIATLRRELARGQFDRLLATIETVNDSKLLIGQVDDVPPDTLREMSDWFRNLIASGVMVLGTVYEGKPQLVAGVTDDLAKQGLHAGNLIRQIAPIIGGGGGGRPTMAQAGGNDASKLPDALVAARAAVSQLSTS
jgi:alanyl-tRNA synthetase